MCRSKELTEDERLLVVGMAKGLLSVPKIAAETKRLRETITTILRRFRTPRFRRPLVTTSRDEKSLGRLVKEDHRATAKIFSRKRNKVTQKVSEMPTRRRLHSLGFN